MAAKKKITWPAMPIMLLLMTFALPPETSLSLGSLRLSPYRVLLIIMFFPAINKMMSNRKTPFSAPDTMMLMHGLWAMASLFVTMGMSEGIETAGIYLIESFGAYILARAYITTPEDFKNAVCMIFIITATLLAFAFIESISGVHILREPFKAILGGPGPHVIEPRLGLTRAFASFDHPILFGVFAASGLAGTYFVLCNAEISIKTAKKLIVVFGATFLSLSGGPFVAFAFQGLLITWDRITRGIANRWYILLGLFGLFWFAITMLSNRSPLLVFISYMTFSANSAYNRVHIWTYGTAEVVRHPLFGIGLNDWIRAPWMSSSMDNFWLLTTVRYGIPALIFLLLAVWFVAKKQSNGAKPDKTLKNYRKAWLITFMGFLLSGLTVHFWNGLMVQLFFLIGSGMALVHSSSKASAQSPTVHTKPMVQKKGQLSWI